MYPPSSSHTPLALALAAILLAHLLPAQVSAIPCPQSPTSTPSDPTPAPTPAATIRVYYLFGFDIASINKLPNWAFNLTILGLVLVLITVFLAVLFLCRLAVKRWRRSAAVAVAVAVTVDPVEDKDKMRQVDKV